MKMTFAQKILALKSGQSSVETGQIVTVRPDHLLTHDNTAAIIGKIGKELDQYGVVDPELSVIVLDHVIPAASEKHAVNHQKIRRFAEKHKLIHFYDIGEGICHQVVFEKGIAVPGKLILGSDSHTCSYGAVGCFSTGIDRTEAAVLMLSPIVPHICHQLWHDLGRTTAIVDERWPDVDDSALTVDMVQIVVQVNGKLRARIDVGAGLDDDTVKAAALAEENVQRFVGGKEIRKVIYVPGKLVNVVV